MPSENWCQVELWGTENTSNSTPITLIDRGNVNKSVNYVHDCFNSPYSRNHQISGAVAVVMFWAFYVLTARNGYAVAISLSACLHFLSAKLTERIPTKFTVGKPTPIFEKQIQFLFNSIQCTPFFTRSSNQNYEFSQNRNSSKSRTFVPNIYSGRSLQFVSTL